MKYAVIISDGTFPCNTAPLQGPLEDCFRRAAELGFDGVQLTVKDPQEVDPAELNALCRQYGLCVSGLATGQIYTKDGFGMGCGEETRRKTAVRRLSQWGWTWPRKSGILPLLSEPCGGGWPMRLPRQSITGSSGRAWKNWWPTQNRRKLR